MSASISPIGKAPQRAADDRLALKQAHAKRAEARDAQEGHAAAVKRARDLVLKAEAKLKRARTGVEESKIAAAKHSAKAIIDGRDEDAEGNGVVLAARHAELNALDTLESVVAAAQQISAEIDGHDAAAQAAEVAIVVAIRQMLAPRIRAALERVKALDTEAVALWGLLFFALEGDDFKLHLGERSSMSEVKLASELDKPFSELREEVQRMLRLRNDMTNSHRAASAWKRAAEDLRTDVDARLPSE